MPDKYISANSVGLLVENVPTVVSTGVAQAGTLLALNSQGYVDLSAIPPGVGVELKSIVASEALIAGDLVNIWDNAGTPSVRRADASSPNAGKQIDGFVLEGIASGELASVYTDSGTKITGLAGLTAGVTYYLSGTTPGALSAVRPTASGYTMQVAGRALSATELKFNPGLPIVLA